MTSRLLIDGLKRADCVCSNSGFDYAIFGHHVQDLNQSSGASGGDLEGDTEAGCMNLWFEIRYRFLSSLPELLGTDPDPQP